MARPLRFLIACLWLGTSSAFAQDITLTVNAAELKVIAQALDAPKIRAQTQSLVIKLQSQINAQFPPGPLTTELPLPRIQGRDR